MCPLPEPHTGTFFLNLFYCYLKCHFHLAGISGDGSSSFFQTFYHAFGSNRSYFLIRSFPFHRRFGCDRAVCHFQCSLLAFLYSHLAAGNCLQLFQCHFLFLDSDLHCGFCTLCRSHCNRSLTCLPSFNSKFSILDRYLCHLRIAALCRFDLVTLNCSCLLV